MLARRESLSASQPTAAVAIFLRMPLSYLHYDVFKGEALLGNQLAVFTDARGLDTAKMQRLAREMNFSESTFILPAERSDTDIRMRIFTPMSEMPMAGHPTIGSTFALAQTGVIRPGSARFVFGLNIGPVPVDLEWNGSALRFAWMTQSTPTFGPSMRMVSGWSRCAPQSTRSATASTRCCPRSSSTG